MSSLLAPMSEVAGRMAPQAGAHFLERYAGGRGVLLGGVSGVQAGKVVVLGRGVSGLNAAAIALGMQAEVLLFDRNIGRLREVDRIYQGHMQTMASNRYSIEQAVIDADLVIGAVLVAGAKAPTLVSNELVRSMKPGSVLVDISVDQGGCFEDTRPTTHDDPVFPVHGSIFYCVANMPGAVPHTSTYALTNVTLPYVMALADRGWRAACGADPALAAGLSTSGGELHRLRVGVGPEREERELLGLLRRRLGQLRAPVPRLHDEQPREPVEVAPARGVPDVRALAPRDHGDRAALLVRRVPREVHPEVVAGGLGEPALLDPLPRVGGALRRDGHAGLPGGSVRTGGRRARGRAGRAPRRPGR